MAIVIIALYVLAANGFVVPQGCFIASWILAGLSVIKALKDD